MTITTEEAIARVMLGIEDKSLRLLETTRKADGSKAVLLCITTPTGLIRPIADMTLILDAADAGRNYDPPKDAGVRMNAAWQGKYGRPIGE